MKTEDRYHKFVQWSDEDDAYIGYCPDLFPAGGVCHGDSAVEAYASLCELVAETVAVAQAQSLELPPPRTRAMVEPLLA
jgi:predicted RNase H-like HicB family nuclease